MTDDMRTSSGAGPLLLPAIDVFEDTGGITIKMDLPGVGREGLAVSVDGETLTIEGRAEIQAPSGMELVHAEVRAPRYRRSFTLSRELAVDRIDALLRDGVLTLSIPKRGQARAQRIQVRTA